MRFADRLQRHLRLTALARRRPVDVPNPPFLTLYINSICNQTCEHCLYWRNLNRRDDLTFAEFQALSEDLGPIENLNLSGGEPFLRKEFGDICRMFIRNNGVKQIYVPTNASFADRTVRAIEQVLQEPDLQFFVVEMSLDGMPEFHNRFRGMADSFERAMETYRALVDLQRRDARLRIHAISTAADNNIEEIRRLSAYLNENCPAMDHHTLGMIRGDRKNPSLQGPALEQYRKLYDFITDLWAAREAGRYGGIVEPMLQWTKLRTLREKRQVVGCKAGVLTGVIYSNGGVSVCETREPFASIREKKFSEIWRSAEAAEIRRSIAANECWCTNEIAMWPSIVFDAAALGGVYLRSKAWRKGDPARVAAPPQQETSPFRVLP